MRVLDITSAYSSSCGGIKRYYREKARALPRLGVECHFVVPGDARTTEPFGDATLHRLPGPPMPGNGRPIVGWKMFKQRKEEAEMSV